MSNSTDWGVVERSMLSTATSPSYNVRVFSPAKSVWLCTEGMEARDHSSIPSESVKDEDRSAN